MRNQGPLYIGVDGGGTKTVAVVMDVESNVVGRAISGCSNWRSIGTAPAHQAVRECVEGALFQAEGVWDHVASMCLAMSGVDTEHDRAVAIEGVRNWIPHETPVTIYNDAVGALACGTDGRPRGCVLIAGTGTIAYGVGPDGRHARAGGWGPTFLDGGSGYDIGQRGLAAAARAWDGRGPRTSLLDALCQHCGVEPWEGLLQWAYEGQGWARIAELAPVVVRCAEAGDEVALGLVSGAAQEAVRSVATAAERCGFQGEFDLVLSGGLLMGDSGYADMVREHIRLTLPHARVLAPKMEAAVGAALLAKSEKLDAVRLAVSTEAHA